MFRLYRIEHRITTRDLADDIGIPSSTLGRFERIADGIHGETLVKMLVWVLQDRPRTKRGTARR
jgi:hypothetical protein